MPNLTLTVNGRSWSGEVRSGTSLLDLLREQFQLTGAKLGCGEGLCGSCTVLVDRRPIAACITQAATVAGAKVTTIEGLAPEGRLHPVQQAFVQAQAFQCGFCTPGMVTAAVALLERTPSASEDGDQAHPRRAPLPVRRLPQDHRGGARRGRGDARGAPPWLKTCARPTSSVSSRRSNPSAMRSSRCSRR